MPLVIPPARESALLTSPRSPHTYKIPPRLVLHETKKQAYIADLANPAVPLHRLSRSIPHGFKGVDLLEMLANNDVALDRALWFIKVCGGSELVRTPSSRSACSPSSKTD
jgi:mediator of RNA polymerase II transcription subunit 12